MWLVLPAIFIAALLTFIIYYHDKKFREAGNTLLYSLMTIRFLIIFLVSFLLLSPVIKYIKSYLDNPIIILAQDKSESISLVKNKNQNYYSQLVSLKKQIQEDFDIQDFSFGDGLTKGLSVKSEDKQTDFSSLFDEINSNLINYNIGALVIASDGLYNNGPNPLYITRKLPFPVYCIALGDTTPKKDIILTNVYANKLAFLGDIFSVEVSIASFGFNGQDVLLTVRNDGKEIQRQLVHIEKNDFNKTLTLELPAERKGLQSFTIEVERKPGEFDILNNKKEIIIDIVDDKKKVLILANSVHPDIGAIKTALESNRNVLIDSKTIDEFNGNVADYQLVIFHQLPSLQYNLQKFFSQINQKLIPAFFILGPQTDIQSFNQLKTGVNITGNNRLIEQSVPYLNTDFKLFDSNDKIKALIDELPPASAPFGNYAAEGQLDVLLFQQIKNIRTPKPLLCFVDQKDGVSGKMAFFMGAGLWRWRMQDYIANENHFQFDELMNKIVHFLALDVRKERFMLYHNRIFNENDEIIIRAEIYNKSYELNNEAEISLQLTNSVNKEFKYQFSKYSNSYSLNLGRLPVDNYKYLAKTKYDGNEYVKSGEFEVVALNIEHQNLTANHSLLNQIALQTGGKMFYPNQLDELEKELKNNETIKPISRSIIDLIDLIELKWIFVILVVLLSTEWFLRKYNGSY